MLNTSNNNDYYSILFLIMMQKSIYLRVFLLALDPSELVLTSQLTDPIDTKLSCESN